MSNEFNDWINDNNQMLRYTTQLGISALSDFATDKEDNLVAIKTLENINIILGETFDKLSITKQNDKLMLILKMLCEALILYSNEESGYAKRTLEEIYKYFPEEDIFATE